MENFTFSLPYKVKILEKNFSIIIITKNEEEKLKSFLNSSSIIEFKTNGGEVYILNIGDHIDDIILDNDLTYKIEDGSNFYRTIDSEMSAMINDRFRKDDENIINDGDRYIDYSGARNYIASLSSTDMIFMIDIDSYFVNFNIVEIEKYIDEGYDKIDFINYERKNHIFEFYNKKKFTWFNVVNEILINTEEIKKIDIPEFALRIALTNKIVDSVELLTGLAVNNFLNLNDEKLCQSFAIELMNRNLLNSSYEEFNRHLTICESNNKKSISLIYIGDYFMKTEQDKKAIEYYNKAYIECSQIRTHLFKLGQYFYFKKEYDKCIFYLEGCLNIPKPNEIDLEDEFVYKDGPYSMLYVAYWWIGNIQKGKYYFDKAIEINPYNTLYIEESIYHYKYKGNYITGSLTFQEIQYLYTESSKVKSILEVYPENGRGTHALLNGCDGLVTVILNTTDNSQFLNDVENPGNLRILNMTSEESINFLEAENEKFDMVLINNYNDIIKDYNPYWGILIWEKFANKLLCGTNYHEFKTKIDEAFEISGITNNIWYKNISQFEKTITYKNKN